VKRHDRQKKGDKEVRQVRKRVVVTQFFPFPDMELKQVMCTSHFYSFLTSSVEMDTTSGVQRYYARDLLPACQCKISFTD